MLFFLERYSLAMELLGLIGGDNSEVKDLSDIDDPVWRMLNNNLHDRSQAAVKKTVVGVRTKFHSPVNLSGDVNISVMNMKDFGQIVTLPDHAPQDVALRHSRMRLMSQAIKNSPRKGMGSDAMGSDGKH